MENEGFKSARPGEVLQEFAQRLKPAATWDDLILPAPPYRPCMRSHRRCASAPRFMPSGDSRASTPARSASALFAGPSGTGKTMAAEVLANHLQLDLYRIDLSAVIHK